MKERLTKSILSKSTETSTRVDDTEFVGDVPQNPEALSNVLLNARGTGRDFLDFRLSRVQFLPLHETVHINRSPCPVGILPRKVWILMKISHFFEIHHFLADGRRADGKRPSRCDRKPRVPA